MKEAVNHPPHYTKGGIECIEAIKASMTKEAYKGYLKGNVLKYIWRYEDKGKSVEDLKKAQVYIGFLLKEVDVPEVIPYKDKVFLDPFLLPKPSNPLEDDTLEPKFGESYYSSGYISGYACDCGYDCGCELY